MWRLEMYDTIKWPATRIGGFSSDTLEGIYNRYFKYLHLVYYKDLNKVILKNGSREYTFNSLSDCLDKVKKLLIFS